MGEVTTIRPKSNPGKRALELSRALVPFDQIEPVLDQPYLIKGWLDRGAASVLYGESNVGKTFLALDIALHVAAGLRWHGVRVAEACPVIYIATEGPYSRQARSNLLCPSTRRHPG